MKIIYLKGVKSLQELKQVYRQLAREHHPDFGGSEAEMKQINAEFEYLYEVLPKTKQEQASSETAEDYMVALEKVSGLPGITIELCGTWLWITGDTKPMRQQLRAAGFKFAGKKQAWYWHSGEYKKRGRRRLSLNEIRNLYGSEQLENKERQAIG